MNKFSKTDTGLIIEGLLQQLHLINSYYKINPRIKSNLSLKHHKYFVKLIKRLKILGILPFKSVTDETF
uniref:ORF-F n=1 Tax=Apicomplexa sp. WK-2018_Corallicola TaxID=2304055 RepID=A0A346KN78_9APIC|nr:ORF-F [Apicomplexa sp. WK-2018_Corallicola]